MKLTSRCGEAAVAGLNEALWAKAAGVRLLRTARERLLRTARVRADTTVIAANVAYPTGAGLLAKAVGKLVRAARRVKAAGGAAKTGPGRVDERCWLRAGGVGPGHGSADPGRGAAEHAAAAKGGPVAQAWPRGPRCPDADTRGPPPRAPPIAVRPLFQGHEHPPVQACFHCRGDGHRRVVGHALPAAADGARDRQRRLHRRVLCPLGGPGRAAAQAEDRRRVGPGRSRIGSPAAGSSG